MGPILAHLIECRLPPRGSCWIRSRTRPKAILTANYLPRKEHFPFFKNSFQNKATILVPLCLLPRHISKDRLIVHVFGFLCKMPFVYWLLSPGTKSYDCPCLTTVCPNDRMTSKILNEALKQEGSEHVLCFSSINLACPGKIMFRVKTCIPLAFQLRSASPVLSGCTQSPRAAVAHPPSPLPIPNSTPDRRGLSRPSLEQTRGPRGLPCRALGADGSLIPAAFWFTGEDLVSEQALQIQEAAEAGQQPPRERPSARLCRPLPSLSGSASSLGRFSFCQGSQYASQQLHAWLFSLVFFSTSRHNAETTNDVNCPREIISQERLVSTWQEVPLLCQAVPANRLCVNL